MEQIVVLIFIRFSFLIFFECLSLYFPIVSQKWSLPGRDVADRELPTWLLATWKLGMLPKKICWAPFAWMECTYSSEGSDGFFCLATLVDLKSSWYSSFPSRPSWGFGLIWVRKAYPVWKERWSRAFQPFPYRTLSCTSRLLEGDKG